MHGPAVFSLALLCLSAYPAAADWGQFEYDFDENQKAWQEIRTQLPAAPKPENLIAVKLDSSTRNRLLIDSASLSSGEDRVVRYTAVIRSPSGAETISFEGLRCDTGERKLYAFGRANGDWSRNRYVKWEPVRLGVAGGYQSELFLHYFCTEAGRRDVPTLIRLLKSGGIYDQ